MVIEIDGSIVTALAILFSAAIAIILGIFNYRWATSAARTKATYDALNQKSWDQDYIRAKSLFIAARNEGGGNGLVEAAKTHRENPNPDSEKMSAGFAIRLIMNDYELMFIGIENRVLDKNLYKQNHKHTVITDYQETKAYVEWVRKESGNVKLYEVFQRNAEEWKNEGTQIA